MFRVTINMFSGRPDPTWIVTDDDLSRLLQGQLRERPEAFIDREPGPGGLGFTGATIEFFGDDHRADGFLPTELTLADGAPGQDLQVEAEIVRALMGSMEPGARIVLPEHSLTPIDPRLQAMGLDWLERFIERDLEREMKKFPWPRPIRQTVHDRSCEQCVYEQSRFNPGFWNASSVVRRNNCYNYARNWRTNTFAQPGRASGNPLGAGFSGADVVASASSDGLKRRCDCLPESEYPRRLMALVYAPDFGYGYPDYHWYREHIGGFWGHKPGGTDARNYDNSANLVVDPQTCDRGPYTEFHGFFYAGKSVIIA